MALAEGSPLDSPENSAEPGVSRPSALLDEEAGKGSEESSKDPGRQMTEVISQIRKLETDIDQIAQSFPAAAPNLRKTKDFLRKALQQIVATGSGSSQETPSPRMLG